MIGIPWFLAAAGIVLVVVGFLLAMLLAATRPKPPPISPKMRDDEIAKHLDDEERISFPGLVIYLGLLCLLAGAVLRMLF